MYYSDEPIPPDFMDKDMAALPIYPIFAGSKNETSCTHFYGRVRDSQRRTSSDSAFASSLQLSIVESEDDLDNGKKAYYAVVARDRYGRRSSPVMINATPIADDRDQNIPPEKVIAARSYGVDFETISVKWINPVTASRFFDIDGWLDDNVIMYFRVTDIYGKRIDEQDEFEISFSFNDTLRGLVLDSPATTANDLGSIGTSDLNE